jgi:hypothetical protein
MADVFISYKSERRAAVDHVAGILRAHGYSIWYDADLRSGQQFSRRIEHELRAARAVVVLWCGRSIASDWVISEAAKANASGKLVPVMIEPVDLPLPFNVLDTIDLSQWRATPRILHPPKVLQEVGLLVGRPPVADATALKEQEAAWRDAGGQRLADMPLLDLSDPSTLRRMPAAPPPEKPLAEPAPPAPETGLPTQTGRGSIKTFVKLLVYFAAVIASIAAVQAAAFWFYNEKLGLPPFRSYGFLKTAESAVLFGRTGVSFFLLTCIPSVLLYGVVNLIARNAFMLYEQDGITAQYPLGAFDKLLISLIAVAGFVFLAAAATFAWQLHYFGQGLWPAANLRDWLGYYLAILPVIYVHFLLCNGVRMAFLTI